MEHNLRVNLSRNGGGELFRAFVDAKVPIYETRSDPGSAMASGHFIEIVTAVGGASLIPSIAFVLHQWLKNKASRKIIIQTKDKEIVHVEGLGLEELERVLDLAESLSAVQLESDDSAT